MHIELSEVRKNFYEQDCRKKNPGLDPEIVLKRVYDALSSMFDLPATPENMWTAEKAAILAIAELSKEGRGWLFAGVMGFITSAGLTYGDKQQKDRLELEKEPFYFMQFHGITDEKAKQACERGDATIGELFMLQPSIFTGD